MNYIELLKRAYKLTLKNRFLWIFGLFVGASSMGGANFNQFGNKDASSKLANITQDQIYHFLSQHIVAILVSILALLAVMIICFIFSLLSQVALIGAANKLVKEEKTDFSQALKIGRAHFWRFWGLAIIFSLIIFVSLIIFGLPLALFITAKMIILAIIWGILALIIWFFIVIVVSIVVQYAYRILILENKSITKSISLSGQFVKKHLQEVIMVYVSLFVVGTLFGLAMTLGIFISGGILFLLGYALHLASSTAAIIYALVAGLAFSICLITVSAAYSAFHSVTLTLAYKELKAKE